MNQIVLASGNLGKLKEIQAVLGHFDVELLPQSEFGIEPPPETGLSFIENALIKARYASEKSGLPALADDSGIAVEALGGAPGIYSARYAGENATDQDNVQHLLAQLTASQASTRAARFICVMAFVQHAADPVPLICQGEWDGMVAQAPAGADGFGYDPVFYVPSEGCTAAELSKARKNQISHRGQALERLKTALPRLFA